MVKPPGDLAIISGSEHRRRWGKEENGSRGRPGRMVRAVSAVPARPKNYRPASPSSHAGGSRATTVPIWSPAHLSFGLFIELLDGIPPMGISVQLVQRGRGERVIQWYFRSSGWPSVARSPTS